MRKASKILTLILIVVFVVSVFAGCNLVGRNVANYRGAEAMQIGGETITVGKLLDTFNTYYNNYYYYISQGILGAEDLLEMVISSLVQQSLQIDDYVAAHKDDARKEAELTALEKEIHNAQYLTKAEFEYAVKYVNYLIYNAFDQYTDSMVSTKLDLDEEPTEDTSRDFTEYDDWKGAETYAEYLFNQNFDNEDADEYFEENYPYANVTGGLNLNGYIYDVNNAEQREYAQKRVDAYNERRKEDEKNELTVEDYAEILQDTKKQYEETIRNNYGVSIDAFMKNQLSDLVNNCIVAKWNYQWYGDLESAKDGDNFVLEEALQTNYNVLNGAQIADFNINGNFDSFITGLSSSSNIYNIPSKYLDKYVFVKNILIPFSTVQTTLLTDLSNKLGGTDNDLYVQARNEYAAEIVAQYFDSDKYVETEEGKTFEETYFNKETWFADKKKEDDKESLWKTTSPVFETYQDGEDKTQLRIAAKGVLGQFFNADGTLKDVGKEPNDLIVELMKRFNTDTAQHTAAFDYVVYVGEDWEDYSHSWVKEFYTAVNEDLVVHNGSEITLKDNHYTLCVSSYGVHIIYLSGDINSKKFDFDYAKHTDTSDPNYNLFKTYFDTQRSLKTQDAIEELERKNLKEGDYTKYITLKSGFDRFLSDNGFSFDLQHFVESLVSEL